MVGCGRVGRLVAQMLERHGMPYLAIDSDADLVAAAKRRGFHAAFGNAARADLLEKLGLDACPAVILTMDEPVLAQRLTRKLRAAHPDLPIVARARGSGHAAELYRSGATTRCPRRSKASLQLSEAVLVELGVPMGPVIASIHEKRDELREEIKDAAGLEREPVRRVRTRHDPRRREMLLALLLTMGVQAQAAGTLAPRAGQIRCVEPDAAAELPLDNPLFGACRRRLRSRRLAGSPARTVRR